MNDAHTSGANGTSHLIRGGCYNEIYVGQMEDIFEDDTNSICWTVYKQERIGQGFYGEVYRGTRVRGNEMQQIAIKKLKTETEADQNDFEREIRIMKVNRRLKNQIFLSIALCKHSALEVFKITSYTVVILK